VAQWASSETWNTPAAVPTAGNWMGSLSGYGDVAYFSLNTQANRTLSVTVTALDESGRASESKAQPVIGMWAASDPPGTAPPAFTPAPFNTPAFGLTQLNAQVSASAELLIGISDLRGDGRPDYHYNAFVLYADSVAPPRLGVSGGAITIQGTGFAPGLTASIGTNAVTPLAVSAGQIILDAPAETDGLQSVTITDPRTGNSSTITNALTFGAAATDNIVLLGNGLNPSTAVGTEAPKPVKVQVLAADGVTPVGGATVGWSASNGLQLSACNAASSCSVTTDQSGNASTWLTPAASGTAAITATLAPGVYAPAKSVGTTLYGIESSSDIGVLTPYVMVSQGASTSIPLTARVLSNGVAQSGATVDFTVVAGSGTLSAASALTNSTGYATVTVSLSPLVALVQVSACVAPANTSCAMFYANPVPLSQQNLQPVSGTGQVSAGQSFQPVVVRVIDSASPPNPVLGAPVVFQTTVMRPSGTPAGSGGGETNPINPAMPVILSVSQSTATSDINGLASVVPSPGTFNPPLAVSLTVTAGTTAWFTDPLEVVAATTGGTSAVGPPPPLAKPPAWTAKPVHIQPVSVRPADMPECRVQ